MFIINGTFKFSFAQNIDLNKGNTKKTVITPKYNLNMLMEKS
jgi:hypothetical protein